jgi:hypothetical protein
LGEGGGRERKERERAEAQGESRHVAPLSGVVIFSKAQRVQRSDWAGTQSHSFRHADESQHPFGATFEMELPMDPDFRQDDGL